MCEYLRPVVATSHGDVEDMELSDTGLHKSLEITNALIAVHVTSHLRHYTVYTRR